MEVRASTFQAVEVQTAKTEGMQMTGTRGMAQGAIEMFETIATAIMQMEVKVVTETSTRLQDQELRIDRASNEDTKKLSRRAM